MLLKMSAITLLYVLLTVFLWKKTSERRLTAPIVILIGILYGICSVLSTHFGIDFGHMLLNVRDIGPLAAGLFFHPASGVIAGLIGGIERYIAGTLWGIGSYTRVACSVSTCLAGFFALFTSVFLFKRKRPTPAYAFFMGAVMEVFHMYVILITHRTDMKMAYFVVKNCSYPMILFTGTGLGVISIWLQVMAGEWKSPLRKRSSEEEHLSDHFQHWLFVVIAVIFLINFASSYIIQSQTALQAARDTLTEKSENIRKAYKKIRTGESSTETLYYFTNNGSFDIIKPNGIIAEGNHKNFSLSNDLSKLILNNPDNNFFHASVFNIDSICKTDKLEDGMTLLTLLPLSEVYADRDMDTLETAYADILLIAGVYFLISFLVQMLVVNNLDLVNGSLEKITNGDLDESVSVRSSSEFASLSDDINLTVDVLKGYISAAEKKIEEELILARTIQDSALPKNFKFPRDDFDIYALMDPAKEVGGDFYDFFFIDTHKLVLVIADVSGKGIPASLFMMRSKTAIRGIAEEGISPAEILSRVNTTLCEGNDADMFVTVWIGIIDLETGSMMCANAGHEYPALMRNGGDYELYKDKHSLALAAMPGLRLKEYEVKLEPGDKLFVYTDGVPEAINEQVQDYGTGRMIRVLNDVKDSSMEETLTAVRQDMIAYVGNAEQFDDITMLGLTYNPSPAR